MFDLERDESAVELDQFVPAPPAVVWRAVTEPALLAEWFARTTGFAPTVGTAFIFELPSSPPAQVVCEVLVVDEVRRFMYSYTDLRGDPPVRWMVDWRLEPHGRGTRILLDHTGFDITDRRQRMARNAAERGWQRTLLPRLAEVIGALG